MARGHRDMKKDVAYGSVATTTRNGWPYVNVLCVHVYVSVRVCKHVCERVCVSVCV
jgi:hypothetical protein